MLSYNMIYNTVIFLALLFLSLNAPSDDIFTVR